MLLMHILTRQSRLVNKKTKKSANLYLDLHPIYKFAPSMITAFALFFVHKRVDYVIDHIDEGQ